MGTKEPTDEGNVPDADVEPLADVDDEAPTPAPRRVDTVLQEPLQAGPTELGEPSKSLRHDPREVRRLVAMAFSAGELSKYAERWRVFTDREGSVDDGARQLVRALEARGKLGQLVESLRAHKPLFEWPEPTLEVDEVPQVAPAPPGPPAAEAKAPPAEEVSPIGAPIVDPFAVREDAHEPAGIVIPKQWLVIGAAAAAALLVVVIVVAATTGDESPTASLATGAADELARSVAAVRSACKIEEASDSARDALTAAFRRCSLPAIRPSRVDVPLPARPKPTPAPQPLAVPRPTGPVSRRPACLDQCHQIHNQCKQSQCGQEPASAAAYDTYQRCLSGCLSQYSRCRLTCR
ncbi:MAG TPA: hypothetical protein ENK57_05065 [Polyangiaceae bacterium]|nr:hypothetical protein [Polyangiaceae bacterium]